MRAADDDMLDTWGDADAEPPELTTEAWRKDSETLGGMARKVRAGLAEECALVIRAGVLDALRGGGDGWTLGENGDVMVETVFLAFNAD